MNRDRFSPVPAIDAKVTVHCDNNMSGIKFAHPYQTEIGHIRAAVSVTLGEFRQLGDVAIAIEGQATFHPVAMPEHTNSIQVERQLRPRRLRKSARVQ
ncbi:MAG TPA: hypothetical protein VKY85_23500 [Candidatus Angelobacter sp.]|nr:hypothetical protein [Candidatus Angelobacter sp.]